MAGPGVEKPKKLSRRARRAQRDPAKVEARVLRRRRWVIFRMLRVAVVAVSILAATGVVGAVALSRTERGRTLVLERVLAYLAPRINGVVEVGTLGPAGLLGGARIHDFRVSDSAGRSVIEIDSLQLRYSLVELLGGTPAIADLSLWNPRVVLERTDAGEINLAALLNTGSVQVDTTLVQDSTSAGTPFRIRDAAIHGGTVVSRLAAGTDSGAPDDWKVGSIEADFGRIDLPGEGVDATGALRGLSFEMPLEGGTFRVDEARGALTLGDETFRAELPLVRLPNSEGGVTAFVEWGADGLRSTSEALLTRLALEDVAWLDERIPSGVASGEARFTIDAGGYVLNTSGIDIELGPGNGRLGFTGGLIQRDGFRVRGAEVAPRLLPVSVIQPWVDAPLQIAGNVSGNVLVEGPPDSLALEGWVTLQRPGTRDTLAHAAGSGTLRGPGRVAGLDMTVQPLDYSLLQPFDSLLVGLKGEGSLSVVADGALRTGMNVEIAANHDLAGYPSSSVSLTGQLYGETTVSVVDLAGTVAPLSLTGMAELFPGLPVAGEVEGTVSVAGPVDRLEVGADLETPAGPLNALATFNARNLSGDYDLAGSVEGFRLSEVFTVAPDPTVVTGSLSLRGEGLDPESLRGRFDIQASQSQVGAVQVDTVDASVWIDDEGRLNVEGIYAAAEGAVVEARGGRIGVAPGSFGEGVIFTVDAPSIEEFRPVFIGGSLLAKDSINEFNRPVFEFDGIDVDTLPEAIDIRLQGAVTGQVEVEGSIDDLLVRSDFDLLDFGYRRNQASRVHGNVTVTGIQVLPPESGPRGPMEFEGELSGDTIVAYGRPIMSASATGTYSTSGFGRTSITIDQGPEETYEAQGVIQIGEESGRVNVDRLALTFEDRRWTLRGPASVEWSPEAYVINDFGLIRPGQSGLRALADGRIARTGGESDFTLRIAELDLERLGALLQLERPPAGMAALDMEVTGAGVATQWETAFLIEDVQYGILNVDQLTGDGVYIDGTATGQIEAREGARTALAINGSAPLDMASQGVDRLADLPLDLEVVADSFPLSMLLGVLGNVEEVDGTVSGTVAVAGRPTDLEPNGSLRTEGGTMILTSLGIRLQDVAVDMDLRPSGLVAVDGSGRSGGRVDVRGTVDLSEIRNPVFDLAFWPRRLQVVNRTDIETAVTGDSITLTGRFNAPSVQGRLVVDDGTVFIEEFQRASQAVNFYDPFFFDALVTAGGGEGGEGGAAIEQARNPFLQSLRVLVVMDVGRGNWLRSREMNVETSGELDMTFDRSNGQLILQGDMDVVRGTYSRLPRTFNMTEGTFRFVGTPGFNPDMDVTAVNRLQTRDGQPLTMTANISGTLLAPQLSLTSDSEVAISEADLMSYLLLGQPSSALVDDRSAGVSAGFDFALGQVASQIGYLLAPELPIDFLSVSQSERTQGGSAIDRGVQVEAGVYVADEVFLAGTFERGSCADPTSVINSWGVRVEVQVPRDAILEGFLEDRCTRDGFRGLGDLSFQLAKIWGFSLYREWGY
ncbi:MAG: translocation/assembly module TamB domain-containing protein [Longimicrobiales bacterium]